jgi:hypothetical protein
MQKIDEDVAILVIVECQKLVRHNEDRKHQESGIIVARHSLSIVQLSGSFDSSHLILSE